MVRGVHVETVSMSMQNGIQNAIGSNTELYERMTTKSVSIRKITSTIMATRRPARIPEDLARDMILNGWDEEPIGGIDSGSDISDVEDPEYCPSGHVRPSETQSAPAEQDQSDTEESSESSERGNGYCVQQNEPHQI
ncbi:hypothetical protein MHYP_G00195350 [Metynnis hypsauchen]